MKEFKIFSFKAILDDEPGVFTGKASVYGNVDSHNDVVMPGAFTKTLRDLGGECPILSQHRPEHGVGIAQLVDRPDALYIKRGVLELEIQQAREDYLRLKRKIVKGISIGYETIRSRMRRDGVRELLEITLWECSLVTFGANPEALIDSVKRDETAALSAMIAELRAEQLTARDRRDLELLMKALRDIRREAEANQPMFFKALKGDRR